MSTEESIQQRAREAADELGRTLHLHESLVGTFYDRLLTALTSQHEAEKAEHAEKVRRLENNISLLRESIGEWKKESGRIIKDLYLETPIIIKSWTKGTWDVREAIPTAMKATSHE